jgi:uncharacterized protein YndB with AHSA1/START domain
MKKAVLAGLALSGLFATLAQAQTVTVLHQRPTPGDRVLRVETSLPMPPAAVWRYFADEEKLKCWVAPAIQLDLKVGGALRTNYDAKAGVDGVGAITLPILAMVPNEQITYKVRLTDNFGPQLQGEDANLQEAVQLQPLANGGTLVVSSMSGWGKGGQWDRVYDFFTKGNEFTYKELVKCAGAAAPAAAPAAPTAAAQPAPIAVTGTAKLASLAFLSDACWRGTMADGKATDTHCFSWIMGGFYLRDRHIVRTPGRPDYMGETLYYYDHEHKQIAYIYYEDGGGFSRGVVQGEDKRLVFPDAEFVHGGGKQLYRSTWTRLTDDSYRAFSEFRKDGKWVQEMKMTLHRVQ